MSDVIQFPPRPERVPTPPPRPLDGARLLRRFQVTAAERRLYRRVLADGMSAVLTAPDAPSLPWFTTRWTMADAGGLRLTVAEALRLSQEAEWAADDAPAADRLALLRVARRWAARAARA
ncbi:MAG: hypothetical protein HIU82_12505 [Proteobacteria bacterium]|nr:hypothetical protein [Pseudomonadota bacterium]